LEQLAKKPPKAKSEYELEYEEELRKEMLSPPEERQRQMDEAIAMFSATAKALRERASKAKTV